MGSHIILILLTILLMALFIYGMYLCACYSRSNRKDKCKSKSSAGSIKCCITEETVQQEQQYQQLQDTVPVEYTIQELSKNETTFLANKQTVELTNIISNIAAKESNSSVQDYGNPVKEFVQESVDVCKEQQEVNDNVSNVDLNQYHTYNNEYNEPTYKKPSPVMSVGYVQYNHSESIHTNVNSTVHEVTQGFSTDTDDGVDLKEKLRIERNRQYLLPNRKLTPEYRYNYYINQLANKHGQYIEFKLKLNRTIRLAKEVGLTDEIIDDLLVNGDRDKYLLTGVNKYE